MPPVSRKKSRIDKHKVCLSCKMFSTFRLGRPEILMLLKTIKATRYRGKTSFGYHGIIIKRRFKCIPEVSFQNVYFCITLPYLIFSECSNIHRYDKKAPVS